MTIDHYLARTIAEWATFVPRPTPILQQKHSLGARLSPKLVEDLASFIFSVAKQPQILPAPQKDFQPLAIVSDDLAPQRADGCWRVLLGQAGSANWAPVANNANPSPLPQPKPFNQRAAQPRLRPDSASRQETSLPFPLDLLRAVANALFELLRRLPFGRSSSVGRDTLQHALQQRDYRLVRQNIVVIAAAGRQAPQQIVEPLAKSLNLASDPEWQIVCCDLLAKIGPAAAGATDALEQLQQHGTDKVRPYAANALREIRRSSQPTPKALPVGEVDHDE